VRSRLHAARSIVMCGLLGPIVLIIDSEWSWSFSEFNRISRVPAFRVRDKIGGESVPRL